MFNMKSAQKKQAKAKPATNNQKKNQQVRPVRSGPPLSMSAPFKGNEARVNGRPGVIIRHREMIRTITAAQSDFNRVAAFEINPGMEATFPWLSRIAPCYEFYHFRSLKFEYVPRCPATTGGCVMMAFDYDATDNLPEDEMSLMSSAGAVSNNIWNRTFCVARPDLMFKFTQDKFVRTRAEVVDKKSYDAGSLSIATCAPMTFPSCGAIYVEYECVFSGPQLDPLPTPSDVSAKIISVAATVAAPFAAAVVQNADLLEPIVTKENTSQLRFHKAGDYLVDVTASGTNALNTAFITPTGPDLVQVITGNSLISGLSNMQRLGLSLSKPGLVTFAPPAAGWETFNYLKLNISPYKAALGL